MYIIFIDTRLADEYFLLKDYESALKEYTTALKYDLVCFLFSRRFNIDYQPAKDGQLKTEKIINGRDEGDDDEEEEIDEDVGVELPILIGGRD